MSEYFRKYLKKELFPVQPQNIRYKTNFRNTVAEALKRRQWKETDDERDWDIIWIEKESLHEIMDHMHL